MSPQVMMPIGICIRPWRLLLIMLAGLLVVVIIPGFSLRAPRITTEFCDEIQVGMTEEQVEEILGCPPGNYSSPMPWLFERDVSLKWAGPDGTAKKNKWVGRRGLIVVCFD